MSNPRTSLGGPGEQRGLIRMCYVSLDFEQSNLVYQELMGIGNEIMMSFCYLRNTIGDPLHEYHKNPKGPDMQAVIRWSVEGLPELDGMDQVKCPLFMHMQASDGKAVVVHPMFAGQRFWMVRFYENVTIFTDKGVKEGHIASASLHASRIYNELDTGAIGSDAMGFLIYGDTDRGQLIRRSVYH